MGYIVTPSLMGDAPRDLLWSHSLGLARIWTGIHASLSVHGSFLPRVLL